MASRDIYETSFDEDVQTNSSTSPCPECDGRVTTNSVETICEDCGLVINEQRIEHVPEWRTLDQDQRKRTGAPLTAARHDRGLSTEIGRWKDANGTNSPDKSASGYPECGVNRLVVGSNRKPSEISHTAWVKFEESRASSNSIRDQACQLFRSAQIEDLLRGRSIEAIAAASTYGACRCNGHSTSMNVAGVKRTQFIAVEDVGEKFQKR